MFLEPVDELLGGLIVAHVKLRMEGLHRVEARPLILVHTPLLVVGKGRLRRDGDIAVDGPPLLGLDLLLQLGLALGVEGQIAGLHESVTVGREGTVEDAILAIGDGKGNEELLVLFGVGGANELGQLDEVMDDVGVGWIFQREGRIEDCRMLLQPQPSGLAEMKLWRHQAHAMIVISLADRIVEDEAGIVKRGIEPTQVGVAGGRDGLTPRAIVHPLRAGDRRQQANQKCNEGASHGVMIT